MASPSSRGPRRKFLSVRDVEGELQRHPLPNTRTQHGRLLNALMNRAGNEAVRSFLKERLAEFYRAEGLESQPDIRTKQVEKAKKTQRQNWRAWWAEYGGKLTKMIEKGYISDAHGLLNQCPRQNRKAGLMKLSDVWYSIFCSGKKMWFDRGSMATWTLRESLRNAVFFAERALMFESADEMRLAGRRAGFSTITPIEDWYENMQRVWKHSQKKDPDWGFEKLKEIARGAQLRKDYAILSDALIELATTFQYVQEPERVKECIQLAKKCGLYSFDPAVLQRVQNQSRKFGILEERR